MREAEEVGALTASYDGNSTKRWRGLAVDLQRGNLLRVFATGDKT